MKKMYLLFVLPVILTLIAAQSASPLRNPPNCHWDSNLHKVVCVISGEEDGGSDGGNPGDGGGGGGGGGGNNGDGGEVTDTDYRCVPGKVEKTQQYYPVSSLYQWNTILYPDGNLGNGPELFNPYELDSSMCMLATEYVDSCTRQIVPYHGLPSVYFTSLTLYDCPGTVYPPEQPPQPPDGCDLQVSWTGSGFQASCVNHTEWECVASIPLPPTYIDVRPFPVTLVRWPTAIRYSGQETSQGSCSVATAGKLSNLTLTLDFKPATGIVTVSLPYLPTMTFTSPSFTPTLFKWEVPSHQAVGGGRLSGTIPGFDEVPGDIPSFEGHMKTPYRLYYTFSYDYPGGTWAESGELLPQDVVNLPQSMIADLNSDGVGDAYWDPNFVISRMDNNNRTDNPLYARHWSWGETIYWLCREGQGQIGWPR